MSGERQEPDTDSARYLHVARFNGERPAGRAYTQLQNDIFRSPDCELSVFRLLLDRQWHVSVLGDPPAEILDRRIRRILSRGTPASLPEEIRQELQRRRTLATRISPWVERHLRPTHPDQ
jgi:hypothetical protein